MSVSGYTTNYSLALIDFNSQNWHDDEHANLNIIDAILAGIAGDSIPFANAVYNSGNQYDATFSPALTAFVAGMIVRIKLPTDVTTNAMTSFKANSLAVKNVKGPGNITTNYLLAHDIVTMLYDGTDFRVIDPRVIQKQIKVSGTPTGATAHNTADDISVDHDADVGTTLLGGAASKARHYFGKFIDSPNAFRYARFSVVECDLATGNLTLGVANTTTSTPAFTNTLEVKTDRVVSKLQLGIVDSGGGTDFMLTNTATDTVTLGFLSGSANGLTFLRGGAVQFNGLAKHKEYTVATLPAVAASIYCRAFVTDANATTNYSIVAGGGANKVPVFSDGTNWRIG